MLAQRGVLAVFAVFSPVSVTNLAWWREFHKTAQREGGFIDLNSSIVNMLTRTYSGAVAGVDGLVIRVEVDLGSGLNAFRVVGLPDAAVREAQVRVR